MKDLNVEGVYLIHLSGKLHHAQHYLGYSSNIGGRFYYHIGGTGSRLIKAAMGGGIKPSIVRVWPGKGRDFERLLKSQRNSPRLCPICNPNGNSKYLADSKVL